MEKRFKKIFSSPNNIFEIKLSKSCYTFIPKKYRDKEQGDRYMIHSKMCDEKTLQREPYRGQVKGLLSPKDSLQLCLHKKIREGMKHKHITQRCSGISVDSLCPTTQLFLLLISPSENILCTNYYRRYNEVVQRISP